MATSTYLSNPVVTVNAVDISDQCSGAQLTVAYAQLSNTAFGDTAMKYVAGLQENSVQLDLYWSTASSETYATLKSLVGTTTNITIKGSSAATSATNPLGTLTGGFLSELPVVYTVGELATCSVTWNGGTFAWSES
jgi:hypothetical protein